MPNTNLAAEFYVLSMLHRLGLPATLTLGNTKAVDIVVTRTAGDFISIDVKGLAGTTGWPIDDPSSHPDVYVVPSIRLGEILYQAPGGRRLVRVSHMRARGAEFHGAWNLIARPRRSSARTAS